MRPKFNNGLVRFYQADARELPLKNATVHCVVTSPPYYGLRVYKTNDDRVLGLESSIEEYIANLVDVFREVKRVLRDDGVCWVNLGDSYGGSGGYYPNAPSNLDGSLQAKENQKGDRNISGSRAGEPGNLLGIPWRVVLALQADGWILRDCIVWSKASPMPESLAGWRWEKCRMKTGGGERGQESQRIGAMPERPQQDHDGKDFHPSAQWIDCSGCAKCALNDGLVLRKGSWRCTSSHEFIFMLVKSMNYWADGEAVKRASQSDHPSGNGFKRNARLSYQNSDGSARGKEKQWQMVATANRKSVWTDIKSEPFKGEHYAVFPISLPRICIQASTSEMGCCPKCENQIARIIEKPKVGTWHDHEENLTQGSRQNGAGPAQEYEVGRTIGWRPSCDHSEALTHPEPALVLDPFGGTMTTCLAAMRLGRRAIGIDLSEDYLKQAWQRLSAQALPLPLRAL